jgi:tetratricopeptide (TPR) repeat protein
MKRTLIILALLGAVMQAAQERFDMKVRAYFFAGLAGNTAALQQGMKICEDILASDPKQPEALVWHGTGLINESREAFQRGDQQKGAQLWEKGLAEMDRAVEIAPDSLGVRIVRGAVLLTASHYLGNFDVEKPLIEKGISDYEKAYSVQGPDLSQLGTHKSGELMIGLADGYSRLGDHAKAQEWFERIQKELPGTPYAKSAATWLETGSLPPMQAGCLSCHTSK